MKRLTIALIFLAVVTGLAVLGIESVRILQLERAEETKLVKQINDRIIEKNRALLNEFVIWLEWPDYAENYGSGWISASLLDNLEFGLRSDGVVIWRQVIPVSPAPPYAPIPTRAPTIALSAIER